MKYYVYRTEIDTMAGYRHCTYLKAIDALKERTSLLSTFNRCDDVDGYPCGAYEAENDEEAIKSFHDGYSTECVKGCGKSYAFMEYTLYRGDEVDAMLTDDEAPFPDMLDYSITDRFDEEENEDED